MKGGEEEKGDEGDIGIIKMEERLRKRGIGGFELLINEIERGRLDNMNEDKEGNKEKEKR